MNLKDYKFQTSGGDARTTWADPYRLPMKGVVEVQGEDVPVLIERPGDNPAASDVVSCIDVEGNIRTVKVIHTRVTDVPNPNGGGYVPIGQALTSRTSR